MSCSVGVWCGFGVDSAMEPLVSKRRDAWAAWAAWSSPDPTATLLLMVVLVAGCLVADHLRAMRQVDAKQIVPLAAAGVVLGLQANGLK